MKGSSRALFQAVVVMGAALAGCGRPNEAEGAPATAPEVGDTPSAATPNEPADRSTPLVAASSDGPSIAADAASSSAGSAPNEAQSSSANEAAIDAAIDTANAAAIDTANPAPIADATATTSDARTSPTAPTPKRKRAKKGECPEGSELPYPPCYYIL